MKGKFKVVFEGNQIFFGNHRGEGTEFSENTSVFGSLLAHDVVEHSVAHRKNTSITFEEEFKALGAAHLIRGLDLSDDITDNLRYMRRKFKPIPWLMSKKLKTDFFLEPELIQQIAAKEDLSISLLKAQQVNQYIHWGYLEKQNLLYRNNKDNGYTAFEFVKSNGKAMVVRYCGDYGTVYVTFDSQKGIWKEHTIGFW